MPTWEAEARGLLTGEALSLLKCTILLNMPKLDVRKSVLFPDLIQVSKPSLIFEFGSWQGRSAVTFLIEAEKLGLHPEIVCVDTWLGSKEHWDDAMPEGEWSYESLGVLGGEPTVIDEFRANIESWGFTANVHMVRSLVGNVESYLKRSFGEAQLVYVDGDHSFRGVWTDLKVARSLCGGVIGGDDWEWNSVRSAAIFFGLLNRQRLYVSPEGSGGFALIGRSSSTEAARFSELGWKRVWLVPEIGRYLTNSLIRRLRLLSPGLEKNRTKWSGGRNKC